jgi:NAD(P)-dependent dehydrogenase (short-subunit alcohol dehydrogenase family)
VTSLSGRVAVVTGAGRGIGAACARDLAAAGCSVVVAARSRGQIERVASELVAAGHRAKAVVCDVTSEESVLALSRAAAGLGPVAVLVNNAGAAASMPVTKTSLEEWNRLLAVNATGAFLCTRALLPGMLERKWGRIVNVASTAGLSGARYIAAYSAAKHALMGFTRSAAAEVAGTGVTVNAVCPGFVDTEMTTESLDRIVAKTGRSREEALAAALGAAGQTRLISAEEVAAAVVSLAAAVPVPPNGEALILDGKDAMSGRFEIINPEALGAPRGWNNGMLARAGGRTLFIAGQTAQDGSGRVPAGDFVSQFDRALGNVLAVVRQAGAG